MLLVTVIALSSVATNSVAASDSDIINIFLVPKVGKNEITHQRWVGTKGEWASTQSSTLKALRKQFGADKVIVVKINSGRCGFVYYKMRKDGTRDYLAFTWGEDRGKAEKEANDRRESNPNASVFPIVCSPPSHKRATPELETEFRVRYLAKLLVHIPYASIEALLTHSPASAALSLWQKNGMKEKGEKIQALLEIYNAEPRVEIANRIDSLTAEILGAEHEAVVAVLESKSDPKWRKKREMHLGELKREYLRRAESALENGQMTDYERYSALGETLQ